MKEKAPLELGYRMFLIDGYDFGMPERTGTYVIREEALTLVETGPSPSVPHIRNGLEKLGHSLEEVRYIILTHIHLDHAGGAGLLLQDCPQATVVVHAKGARHLVDPSRLIAGARAIYGEQFDSLYDPIIPIPEDRILIRQEGESLRIGPERTLQFFDTPGHANHHFSIYDPVSNGMFAGDTAGVYYSQLQREGIPFFLPSTSPNQFDPDKMIRSIERFREMKLDRLYFGHFGMTEQVEEAYRQVLEWLPVFLAEGEAVWKEKAGYEALRDRLLSKVQASLQQQGIKEDHSIFEVVPIDLAVCAMGLLDYYEKKESRRG